MSQTVTVLGEVGEGRTQTLAVASLVATAGMKKHVLSVFFFTNVKIHNYYTSNTYIWKIKRFIF